MSENNEKKCSKCNKIMPLSMFYIDRTPITKQGRFSKCIECCKTYQKIRVKHEPNTNIIAKKCSICGIEKPIELYYKSYRHKDGYFKWCGSCHDKKIKD